ncbi:2-phospho-L-lactate transferase CofD family protein [Ferruginibacter lapsinanis]|uniref:gluconeogenesis factor YvcK family protein n=1 Tax=Ferruginibacter lapsinanis TaxID=563172 RepID=UPI001E5A25CA|nr:2-phospho-L-lactate transferase CofD family protein [Ferruginibacter lapsinanis]UEG50555.1 2-phospho-L-lactate transferase CofD family protein [Ferruginibacter lapsinanis]
MISVVSFNGGRGARNLLPSLVEIEGVSLTSIVNAYDDGKSTGVLRQFFKMLGPSDIRKVQESLLPKSLPEYDNVKRLFDHRYPVPANRDKILEEIYQFATGNTNVIAGVCINDELIKTTLRFYLLTFYKGVNTIEKCEAKKLSLDDCNIMNLVYAGAFLAAGGNFEQATINIGKLFKLSGSVLPTNIEDKKLVAIREDGTILYSEAEIVELRSNVRIKKIYLLDEYPDKEILSHLSIAEVEEYFEAMNRQVKITPRVKHSVANADIIIYSSGTQHSSLYPSYITEGLTDAIIANKKALKIFITNIGEDYETPRYNANDFIKGAIRYLRMGSQFTVDVSDLINIAFINNRFSGKLEENYVKYDEAELNSYGFKVIIDALEDVENPGKHNGKFLAGKIMELYNEYFISINSC